MTIVENTRPVTGGVDTHLDRHVAAALDGAGVEGTGAYGVGLARFLHRASVR